MLLLPLVIACSSTPTTQEREAFGKDFLSVLLSIDPVCGYIGRPINDAEIPKVQSRLEVLERDAVGTGLENVANEKRDERSKIMADCVLQKRDAEADAEAKREWAIAVRTIDPAFVRMEAMVNRYRKGGKE